MSFDALAPTYDTDFTHTPIGRYLRGRVHQRLFKHFQAGDHILEMGCGTGEDALYLAQHGIHITATDASQEMLAITREKTAHLNNVQVAFLDLQNLDHDPSGVYDGAISNFGALNCLSDWQPLAAWLADHVRSDGMVGLGIMAPYCLWELLWHGVHLDTEIALRRLRGSTFNDIPIAYPRAQRITADFAPYFERVHLMPLGLFLPPSDIFGVIDKRPRLLNTLIKLENLLGQLAPLAPFADHYWIEFQRR
jgi:SAM-dependent methyltransferase